MGRKKKIKKTKKTKKTKKVKKRKQAIKKQERVVVGKLAGPNTLKAGDEKIQIKKIKKQPTEKKAYNVKVYVV